MAKYAYHRLDANQPAIVEALEAVGATVYPIGRPVDLLVGYRGVNYLFEVKTGRRERFEVSQVAFFKAWRGEATVVRSVDDALRVLGFGGAVNGTS